MKKVILINLISIIFFSNYIKAQEFTKHIEIIQSIFIESELLVINDMDVIKTKARDNYAHIPINSSACYLLELSDNISVLAFNIYLSEKESDYMNMEENDLYNVYDIEEGSDLMSLKDNERFIQVVFFDTQHERFIGKPERFPIEGLKWMPEGMGDFTEFISINKLTKVKASKSACVLQLYECPSCGFNTYVFRIDDNNIKSSEKLEGCLSDFEEENSLIKCNETINCYEVEYDDEEPVKRGIIVLN